MRYLVTFFLFLLCLSFVVSSCGDGLTPNQSMCTSNSDCQWGKVCVGRFCVGKVVLPSEVSKSSESVTDTSESSKESIQEHSKEAIQEHSKESKPEKVFEPGREKVTTPDMTDGGSKEEPSELSKESEREPIPEREPVPELECQPQQKQVCYDGAAGTAGKGLCQKGQQVCIRGKWGPCERQVLPKNESCGDLLDNNCNGVPDENCPCHYTGRALGVCKDSVRDTKGSCTKPKKHDVVDTCGDGLDNNCNGTVDEKCECKPAERQDCGSDVGECSKGKQTCSKDGKWGNCLKNVPPTAEKCDGKDNNCDGVVDEECPCFYQGSKKGVCTTAKSDKQGTCLPPLFYQSTERCNDTLDNNCDGVVNEGCPCDFKSIATGVCKGQLRDAKGACLQPVDYQKDEKCGDGKDNNCDGVVDEGCPCNYLGKSVGVCKNGKINKQGACQPPSDYAGNQDLCTDMKDNNCDGQVNETCICTSGETQPCGSSVGECREGKQTCKTSGSWGVCVGGTKPTAEVCDNKDNNCNGSTDELCPCFYGTKQNGVCKTAKRNTQGVCEAPTGYSPTEVCDGLDNDCNGVVDEGCPCLYNQINTGVCALATIDQNGVCEKPSDYNANEICSDNKDNNCDGVKDEGCPCLYNSKNEGVCKTATRDKFGNCEKPADYSTVETCDKKDNDCDGNVDNLPPTSVCYTTAQCSYVDKNKTIRAKACSFGTLVCAADPGQTLCKAGVSTVTDCKSNTNILKCSRTVKCPSGCPGSGKDAPKCTKGFCLY